MKKNKKDFFRVIQGKLPSEKDMRHNLPRQFIELKKRLYKLKDLNNEDIKNTQKNFDVLISKYGQNLERDLFIR